MRIAALQCSPVVGDLDHNLATLLAAAGRARAAGCDLLVTPELALCGYPPRDLLDQPAFVGACLAALRHLVEAAPLPILVGSVVGADSDGCDPLIAAHRIGNAAVLVADGRILACHRKNLLPAYDIFDEVRYFTPGRGPTVATVAGTRVGLSVCEDAWNDRAHVAQRRYDGDPVEDSLALGAELLINLSASPFERGKPALRAAMLSGRCRRAGRPLLYVNQVGGQDSVLFDGRSCAYGADGALTWQAAAFAAEEAVVTLAGGACRGPLAPPLPSGEEELAQAITMGLRDYLRLCGVSRVTLGLSGGIDSAVVAALAVRALGPEHVRGLAMPSRYSSDHALADAQDSARRLGIRLDTVPIAPMVDAYAAALAPSLAGPPTGVTEENIQARVRGTLLMAHSNATGAMVLSTGNKSEVAVGYCTLYGDMCGGLAPLADLYKTEVVALAEHLNRTATGAAPVPPRSITKPPSAELRPGQVDADSLPPYPILDAVLRGHIEGRQDAAALVAAGHDPAVVHRVLALVAGSEHKRRQMAPGLRVSTKAFGEGRRVPVAQAFARAAR